MATIALLIILNGLAGWIWAPEVKFLQSPFPLKVLDVGGVVINVQDLGVIGVSLICVAIVFVFFRFTRARAADARVGGRPGDEPAARDPRGDDAQRSAGASRRCSARSPG